MSPDGDVGATEENEVARDILVRQAVLPDPLGSVEMHAQPSGTTRQQSTSQVLLLPPDTRFSASS